MNPTVYRALYAFLQAVRSRLWLQAVLHWTWRGLLPTALWLGVAGLLHSLVYALPLSFCLRVAALPVGIALLVGLWRGRPSLERCAQVADRWFDGKALLISTWDLYHHLCKAHPISAQVILEQAQQAIPQWRDQLRRRKFQPAPTHALISISLGLTGIFLLLAPGAMPKYEAQASLATPAAHPLTTGDTVFNSRRESSAALSALAQPAITSPPKPARAEPTPPISAGTVTQPTPPALDNLPARRPAPGVEKGNEAMAASSADPAGESPTGRTGGANEPGGGDPATGSNDEPDSAAAVAVQWVELARMPSARSPSAGATAMELATAPAPPPHTAPVVVSAAQAAGGRYEAPVGPALQPYLARYFQILHEQQPGDTRSANPVR